MDINLVNKSTAVITNVDKILIEYDSGIPVFVHHSPSTKFRFEKQLTKGRYNLYSLDENPEIVLVCTWESLDRYITRMVKYELTYYKDDCIIIKTGGNRTKYHANEPLHNINFTGVSTIYQEDKGITNAIRKTVEQRIQLANEVYNNEQRAKEEAQKQEKIRVCREQKQARKEINEEGEDLKFEQEVQRRLAKELYEQRVNAEVQRRLAAMSASKAEDGINKVFEEWKEVPIFKNLASLLNPKNVTTDGA